MLCLTDEWDVEFFNWLARTQSFIDNPSGVTRSLNKCVCGADKLIVELQGEGKDRTTQGDSETEKKTWADMFV